MKLQVVVISPGDLVKYLDEYQDKIKFILQNNNGASGNPPGAITLVIDMKV